jgi:hypothetical protein
MERTKMTMKPEKIARMNLFGEHLHAWSGRQAQDQTLRCPALMPYSGMYCSHSNRCRGKAQMLANVVAFAWQRLSRSRTKTLIMEFCASHRVLIAPIDREKRQGREKKSTP